jgi:hypothetical protein
VSADHAALPLLHWNISPSPELTLILFLGPNEQQNELIDAHPKLTARAPSSRPLLLHLEAIEVEIHALELASSF